MNARCLIATTALLGVLPACLDDSDPTGPQCAPINSEIVSTSGDTTTTSTGLRYVTVQEGTGALAEFCERVGIHFTASLVDGTAIDSFQVEGQAYTFTPGIGFLIPGMEEGVVGMQVGGMRRLIVPPELAYGSSGRTDGTTGETIIPPNSTLIFDIDLLAATDD